MKVSVLEARNRLSQLIRAARAGEDIVIANRSEPVARLVAVVAEPTASGSPGNADALLEWLRSHPLPAYARRSAAEIDAGIAAERGGWD
jgi:prevent-host-death family protein